MKGKLRYPKSAQMQFKEKDKEKVLDSIDESRQLNQRKQKLSKWKVASICSVAAMVLLMSLTYFSPSIEKVMANMPYISQIVEERENDLETKIEMRDAAVKVLKEYNLEWGGTGGTLEQKKITYEVIGHEATIKEEKEAILKAINEELNAQGFKGYEINIKPKSYYQNPDVTEAMEEKWEEYSRKSRQLKDRIEKELELNHFELMYPVDVQMNDKVNSIAVVVPKREERISQLKEILLSSSRDYGSFEVNIKQVEKKARAQEKKWNSEGIISDISRAFWKNEEFHVTGISHSFHPYPLTLTIRTSLEHGDTKSKEIADEIEKEIRDYIDLNENVKEDSYVLEILSEDNKRLNE